MTDILETARIRIRPTKPEDAETLVKIRNTEFVKRYNLYSDRTADEMREEFTEKTSLTLILKGEERIFGFVEYKPDFMRYHSDALELSSYLGEEDARKGYTYETLLAIEKYFFEVKGVSRLTAHIYADNIGSIRLVEKGGFRREGYLEEAVYNDRGEVFDLALYTLSKKEYEKRNLL